MKSEKLKLIQPILLAAGSSSRFGRDKMTLELKGKPLFIHSLLTFLEALPRQALIVCAAGRQEELRQLCQKFAPQFQGDIIAGGSERYLSVHNALLHLKQKEGEKADKLLVAVHDAARPFITKELILQNSLDALEHGGAIVARPVTDTIKQMHCDQSFSTPERAQLISAETPQTFSLKQLSQALQRVIKEGLSITDDASAMEICAHKYKASLHQGDNRRITFSSDLPENLT